MGYLLLWVNRTLENTKLVNFGMLPSNTYQSLSVGGMPDKHVSVVGFACNRAAEADGGVYAIEDDISADDVLNALLGVTE